MVLAHGRPGIQFFHNSPSRSQRRLMGKKQPWRSAFPLRTLATLASLCVKEYIFTQRRNGRARDAIWGRLHRCLYPAGH